MKRAVQCLILVMAIAIASSAQDLQDRKAKPFTEISAGGVVTADGARIGKIDKSGTVYKGGVVVGRIAKDGTVLGPNRDTLGTIDIDGNILDQGRVQIGVIERDGTVRDARGLRTGAVAGVVQRWAAAMLIFF